MSCRKIAAIHQRQRMCGIRRSASSVADCRAVVGQLDSDSTSPESLGTAAPEAMLAAPPPAASETAADALAHRCRSVPSRGALEAIAICYGADGSLGFLDFFAIWFLASNGAARRPVSVSGRAAHCDARLGLGADRAGHDSSPGNPSR
jgi:hypothetical protein